MLRRDVIRTLAVGGAAVLTGAGRAIAAEPRVVVSRIQLLGDRVVMPLTINGAGPYLFLIDSGGFLSLIDKELARALKLSSRGSVRMGGVGGRTMLPLYLARDVVFGGGAMQRGVAFGAMESGFNREIRGTLAAGMLTATDSDLDIENGEWRSYLDGRPARSGFFRIDNAISSVASGSGMGAGSPHLYGDATVNGRRLRFLLDTGAPRGFSLDRSVAKSMGLWSDTQPYAPTRPHGVGGEARIARTVRVERAEFGGASYVSPLVTLSGEDRPTQGVDGVIGLQVLRQFNLSTDVKAKALWVKRNANAMPLPDRYGLSGLWLDQERDAITVGAVGTGSPAAKAGMRVGDRIVGDTFPLALRKIVGAPGKAVSLEIERDGARSAIAFTLAPYL
ncbi:aspartyl protease family protein [Sphingomonas sp. PB4P5]|uniref:aspartyl protease family protein n=1 Tax=Parasphingomonas puruogangriensis TaxID=3096155 RepID=UPI002FC82FB1